MDSHRTSSIASSSKVKQEALFGDVKLNLRYPHRLSVYDKPPLGEITLEDFQKWALDRLRVLAEIEASFVRNRTPDEMLKVIRFQLDKHLPMRSNAALERQFGPGEKATTQSETDKERRQDHVSHYILRLAFCRTEELRKRFVKSETALFRARFEDEDVRYRQDFLSSQGVESAEIVSDLEKEEIKYKLAAAGNTTVAAVERESYTKIPWTRVPYLVERRRVFLKGGMAYVPAKEQSAIIFQDFQTRLEKAMEQTAKALGTLDEDERITPIIDRLSKGFLAGVASEYTFEGELGPEDAVKAEMVPDMSRKHWPLCMRSLQECLKKDRHLKHYGRLQYTLFLKAVGMSVEEAMIFWRKSFSAITDDKFNKEYRYNVQHAYGLVGARRNYSAKSCQAILTQNPPSGSENHGCPYRHFNQENLVSALGSYFDITAPADIKEIMDAVAQHKHHVACTRVFEITHGIRRGEGVGNGETVTHPNKYAARSRELEREKNGGGTAVKSEDAMDVDA